MSGNECWLHQVHLPWLSGSSKATGSERLERPRPVPWSGLTGNPLVHESSERRAKLENVLQRASTGQSLSDKDPANSRYGSYGQLQKCAEGLRLILTKSGIAWQEDGRETEIIPLLLTDIMAAPVQQKFSLTSSEATHVILLAPRSTSLSAVWLLCTNAGSSDFSVDHLLINFSRRGAIRWDIKNCCHFLAKPCGEGAHGTVFSGVSLLPLYDSRRKVLRERGDVVRMNKVHNFGRVAVKIWSKPPMSMVRQELHVLQQAAGHPTLSSLLGLYCEGQRRRSAVVWLLVLEHCTGGDLFDYVRDNYVSQNKCTEILMCLLSGLAHLHSLNIVHRDVKAENVVLQKHHAVLIDFGISADVHDEQEMIRPVGSPGYAAPEVIAEKPQRYNEKVDVFATGVLVYFMLYRALPFWSDNHVEILRKTRECEVHYPEDEERPIRSELMNFMQNSLEREAEDRASALNAFVTLRQSAPEEILKGKGGRAARIALAALVKLGHLPEASGEDDFEEFSEDSADTSEALSRGVSPAVTTRSSVASVSMPSTLASMTQSAVRRLKSIRLPRVRPTLTKVLGLSPGRLTLPSLAAPKSEPPVDRSPPSPEPGHQLDHGMAAIDAEMRQEQRKGEASPSGGPSSSTALGSESVGVQGGRSGSKTSQKHANSGDSMDRPEKAGSSKQAPIPEEDEKLLSLKEDGNIGHAFSEDDLLGAVDANVDVHMSVHPDDEHQIDKISPETGRREAEGMAGHGDVNVIAEAPKINVIDLVAAPSCAPPSLVPVAPSSPAPGPVPKHRQRSLAIFRRLLSSEKDRG